MPNKRVTKGLAAAAVVASAGVAIAPAAGAEVYTDPNGTQINTGNCQIAPGGWGIRTYYGYFGWYYTNWMQSCTAYHTLANGATGTTPPNSSSADFGTVRVKSIVFK